jgi:hypothetical protein
MVHGVGFNTGTRSQVDQRPSNANAEFSGQMELKPNNGQLKQTRTAGMRGPDPTQVHVGASTQGLR